MQYISEKQEKIELIQKHFTKLLGCEITGYELPQLWCEEDQEWSDWMDLPLYLTIGGSTLSISWKKFDELLIETGRVLPFSITGFPVRWLAEDVQLLEPLIGQKLKSVSLASDEMTLGGHQIEIWTRLILTMDNDQNLVIYNALDENGLDHFKGPVPSGAVICSQELW
ncbi:hypothetical protein [Kiloniella sp.]|uniref:hypothetical protein n=1 Tax=Kiloniella sp. TaxID=1938587 RepID=UPI003B02647D